MQISREKFARIRPFHQNSYGGRYPVKKEKKQDPVGSAVVVPKKKPLSVFKMENKGENVYVFPDKNPDRFLGKKLPDMSAKSVQS